MRQCRAVRAVATFRFRRDHAGSPILDSVHFHCLPTIRLSPLLFQCLELKMKILRCRVLWVWHRRLSFPLLKSPLAPILDGQLSHSRSEQNFSDSSWPLFAMYSKFAEEEDNKITQRWQKDAEGIIIFVCCSTVFHDRRAY